MDKKESKRILRSTIARKTEISESEAKRLKTAKRDTKTFKDSKTERHGQTKSLSTNRLTSSAYRCKRKYEKRKSEIWKIKVKHEPVDKNTGWISDCHLMDSGELLVTDFFRDRVRKLDKAKQTIAICDLNSAPRGICYIGDNIAVIAVGKQLQFVNVEGDMTLTKTVDIDHYSIGIACYGQDLYIVDDKYIYIYNTEGQFQRELYAKKDAYFVDIAVSKDGSMIYLSSSRFGLVTINSSGNHLFTLSDPDIKAPFGVSLDMNGNVLICSPWSGTVVQVSSDGRQKLGQVIKKDDCIPKPTCVYFDEHTKSLIVGCGEYNNVFVLEMD